jgi:hypothetical protein
MFIFLRAKILFFLRVDQIIMAKRAGGPKARDTSGTMDQDDD